MASDAFDICEEFQSRDEGTIEFSEGELNEMIAADITLDDAIRAVERLRG